MSVFLPPATLKNAKMRQERLHSRKSYHKSHMHFLCVSWRPLRSMLSIILTAVILRVFRNQEKMVYDPPSKSGQTDRIEKSLNEILSLSHEIQEVIAGIKNKKKQVDNYS